jgi:glycerophosphoryl diester phosphodiesterase
MKSWFFLLFCIHMTQSQKDRETKNNFDDAENLIIAHRGLTSLHLENTLSALSSAFDYKADGVEFDVQLSKDMVPMVFHDRNLKRLVNLEANIDDLSLAELKTLSQTSKKYHNFPYPISTLSEVLQAMPPHKLINIELKETTAMKGLDGIKNTLKIIEPYKNKLNIIISSFEPEILQTVSNLDRDYPIGLLINKHETLSAFVKSSLILDHIDYINPHISLINPNISKKIKERGVQLILWGHKKMGEELDFIADKHTALISDIPQELIKYYKNY